MTAILRRDVPNHPFVLGKSTLFTELLNIPMPPGAAVPGQPRSTASEVPADPPVALTTPPRPIPDSAT